MKSWKGVRPSVVASGLGAAFLGCGAVSAAQVVSIGFEETSGITVADSITPPATDGTIINIETPPIGGGNTSLADLDVDGIVGSAIFLDGVNDAVRFENNQTSEFFQTGDFTITLWVKDLTNEVAAARLFDYSNTSGDIAQAGAQGYRSFFNGSTIQFQGGKVGSTDNFKLAGTRAVNPDGWSLVALRYDADGNASITVLYDSDLGAVDASFIAGNTDSIAAIGGLTFANNSPRFGGRADNAGVANVGGLLDEVGVWDTSLTDQELTDYYFTIVPEPSSVALFAAGAGLMLMRQRRRSQDANAS